MVCIRGTSVVVRHQSFLKPLTPQLCLEIQSTHPPRSQPGTDPKEFRDSDRGESLLDLRIVSNESNIPIDHSFTIRRMKKVADRHFPEFLFLAPRMILCPLHQGDFY